MEPIVLPNNTPLVKVKSISKRGRKRKVIPEFRVFVATPEAPIVVKFD